MARRMLRQNVVRALGAGELSSLVMLETEASFPGPPEGAPTATVQDTSLVVTVKPPMYLGGRPLLHYEVRCEASSPSQRCTGAQRWRTGETACGPSSAKPIASGPAVTTATIPTNLLPRRTLMKMMNSAVE